MMRKLLIPLLFAIGLLHAQMSVEGDFEGGNVDSVEIVGDTIKFASKLDPPGPKQKTTWFYFRVIGVSGKDSLVFVMKNPLGSYTENSRWDHLWVPWSYDNENWLLINEPGEIIDNKYVFHVKAPTPPGVFVFDTIYVAYNLPYVYSDALADIARWLNTPFVVEFDTFATSVQGRDMHFLIFDDTTSPIPSSEKNILWITGRQHPLEPGANYQLQGIVDWYCDSADPTAGIFRKYWKLYVVPDFNPDGMYNGYTRTNANGCDMNREWNDGPPDQSTEEKEVYELHSLIDSFINQVHDTFVYFDMHCIASRYPGGYYRPGTQYSTVKSYLDDLVNFTIDTWGAGSFCIQVLNNQYDIDAYTVEGANRSFGENAPNTIEGSRAYGRAWAKAAILTYTTNEMDDDEVYIMERERVSQNTDDDYLNPFYVIRHRKYKSIFDSHHGGQLLDFKIWETPSSSPILISREQRFNYISWRENTSYRDLEDTDIDHPITIKYDAAPYFFTAEISSVFDPGVSNDVYYKIEYFIKGDGLIHEKVTVWNTGTAHTYNNGGFYISLNSDKQYTDMYDNGTRQPNPATEHWIALKGQDVNTAIALFWLGNTSNFKYDSVFINTPSGRHSIFFYDKNGWSQGANDTVVFNLCYKIFDDTTGIDESMLDSIYSILHNIPSVNVTNGELVGFDSTYWSYRFRTSDGTNLDFTYTNAETYPHIKPLWIIENYNSEHAPVLRIDGELLNNDPVPHPDTFYKSDEYVSWVDVSSKTAYIIYNGNITGTDISISEDGGGSPPSPPPQSSKSWRERLGEGWILSPNPGLDEWKGDSLLYGDNAYPPRRWRHFLYPNNYALGMKRAYNEGVLYAGLWSFFPDNYDTIYLIIRGKSLTNPLKLGVGVVSFDGTQRYDFFNDVWIVEGNSSLDTSLYMDLEFNTDTLLILNPKWGMYRTYIYIKDAPPSGVDSVIVDSCYFYTKTPIDIKPVFSRRSVNPFFMGGNMTESAYSYIFNNEWALTKMDSIPWNYTRIIAVTRYLLDTLDISGDSLYYDWSRWDSTYTILHNRGITLIPLISFLSYPESTGARYHTLSGGRTLIYHEDAAFVTRHIMRHFQQKGQDVYPLFIVTNERAMGTMTPEDAESLTTVYFAVKDTIKNYYPDAKVVLGGPYPAQCVASIDSVGCGMETVNEDGWASIHLYGDDYRPSWRPETPYMFIMRTLIGGSPAYSNYDLPQHVIVDEYRTTVDPDYMDSTWTPIPFVGILQYFTPDIITIHDPVGYFDFSLINTSLQHTYYLYHLWKLMKPYTNRYIYGGKNNAPYFCARLGDDVYIAANPYPHSVKILLPYGRVRIKEIINGDIVSTDTTISDTLTLDPYTLKLFDYEILREPKYNFVVVHNPSFEFWYGDTLPMLFSRTVSSGYTTIGRSTTALDGNYSVNLTETAGGKRSLWMFVPSSRFDTLFVSFYTYGPGSLELIITQRSDAGYIYDWDHYYYNIDSCDWQENGNYASKRFSSLGNEWVKHTFYIPPVPFYNGLLFRFVGKNTNMVLLDSCYAYYKGPIDTHIDHWGQWFNPYWGQNDHDSTSLYIDAPVPNKAKALLDTIYNISIANGDTPIYFIETKLHSMNYWEPKWVQGTCCEQHRCFTFDWWKWDQIVDLWKTRYPKMWLGIDMAPDSYDVGSQWFPELEPLLVGRRKGFYPPIMPQLMGAICRYMKSKNIPQEKLKFFSIGNEYAELWEGTYSVGRDTLKAIYKPAVDSILKYYPNAYVSNSFIRYAEGTDSLKSWNKQAGTNKFIMYFHGNNDYTYRLDRQANILSVIAGVYHGAKKYSNWDWIRHAHDDMDVFKAFDELNHFCGQCTGCQDPESEPDWISGMNGAYAMEAAQYLLGAALQFDAAGSNCFIYLWKGGPAITEEGTITEGYYLNKIWATSKLTGADIDYFNMDWTKGYVYLRYKDRDGLNHQWYVNLLEDSVHTNFCWAGMSNNITKVAVQPITGSYQPWDSLQISVPDSIWLVPYEIQHYWGE